MTEEKIKVPAGWLASREKEADRKNLVGEWREYLTAKQRDRLETEGAGAGFKTGIPLEALKAFTPEEREELTAHEEREYRRSPRPGARNARRG